MPKQSAKSVDGNKLGYLESIRGLAALAVVFAHILAAYLPGVGLPNIDGLASNSLMATLFYGLPLGFMSSGHFAVVLFFILSGYVLTYRFFQTNNQHDLHRQAAKRFFRLAIPIFAIVMVAYLMFANGLFANKDKIVELTGSPEVARNYSFTPTIGNAIHAGTVGVISDNDVKLNPVLWTMPIEFFGSFIVFGLAAFITKTRRRWLLYIGAIILLSDSYYVCFILGMLLADIVQRSKVIKYVRNKVSRIYIFLALLVVWVIASFPAPSNGLDGTIYKSLMMPGVDEEYLYRIWQFFGAFLLLSIIIISVKIQNLLNHRFLVYLGGISFAVYLTHYLVLYSVGHFAYVNSRESYGVSVSMLIAGLATLMITLVVSVLWKKYIDDLSVRASRAFADYILK